MQLGEFIIGNWLLFLTLAFILFMLAWSYFGPNAVSTVSPSEAIRLMNHKDAVVVDARTDNEYQGGHIMNSLHIPLGMIEDSAPKLQDYKNIPLVIVCRSGSRSGQAASKLKKLGFEQAHNLSGGMLAWGSANLPTTTKKTKLKKTAKASKDKASEQTSANNSHEVVVYTTRKCPFCTRAIGLLDAKGIVFTEICIDTHPEKREEMEQRANSTSTPQIFIGDHRIGGCDDMYELEDSNQLDELLGLVNKAEQKQTEQQESAA